ncbi:RNA-binding protein MEX3A [Pitangus sulphuratus]|nr:RNA-binding protein MEX3A [Pitangus sulphuratus]
MTTLPLAMVSSDTPSLTGGGAMTSMPALLLLQGSKHASTLSAFKNSPRKPFPLRKSDDCSSPTHPVEVDGCTASEEQRVGQILLSPCFTEILELKPPGLVGPEANLHTLLRQLGMSLKGRERLQSVLGCYKVLMRIGLNLHQGKVRNGIDFVRFELELLDGILVSSRNLESHSWFETLQNTIWKPKYTGKSFALFEKAEDRFLNCEELENGLGCKIKALRAKTNTYIKTPVRGEEPVFMVTGRREDVAMARREIISAAEHFSMIRASRNKAGTTFGSAPTLPGQVTIRVRVPYRVVGLVVGPKGATIKRIQQQTNTYIITPSRDRDPVFEITGAPGNVERAREEIETHIAVRTGKILEYNNENDFLSSSPDSGMENRYSEAWRVHTPAPGCKPLSTFRQNSLGCIGDCSVDPVYETPRLNDQNDFNYGYLFPNYGVNKQDLYYGVPESGAPMWAGQENTNPVSVLFSKQQRSSSTGTIHPNSHRSPSSSIPEPNLSGLPRRSQGEPLQGFSKLGTPAAARTSVASSRECMVCFESEVTAALVPCGHNLFCMECAVRIRERTDPECPVCHAAATQAIRIFS